MKTNLPIQTKGYDCWRVSTQRIIGHLNVPAAADNCFFGHVALWNAEHGFTQKQVRSGDFLLVVFNVEPIFPGMPGYEAATINDVSA